MGEPPSLFVTCFTLFIRAPALKSWSRDLGLLSAFPPKSPLPFLELAP